MDDPGRHDVHADASIGGMEEYRLELYSEVLWRKSGIVRGIRN